MSYNTDPTISALGVPRGAEPCSRSPTESEFCQYRGIHTPKNQ
jgi:hypothetical protein